MLNRGLTPLAGPAVLALCLLGVTLTPRPSHSQEVQVPAAQQTQSCAPAMTLVPLGPAASARPRRVLRVSADPNNLPFTNRRREGFENKIAELLARELDADLLYIWRAQRRGFFRVALKEGECDLVLGVPTGFERALTTGPYYRSTYVFVSRKDRGLDVRSFDDPALRKLKIGVQLIGDDGADTPPAHALARRGLINNVVGFTVYGDYTRENPPARVVEAVAKGDVDVAVVWGPLAGYFARRQPVELKLAPVTPEIDPPALPFAFNISLGVRKGNKGLRDELNEVLQRKRTEVERILDEYGVPRVQPARAEHTH